MAREHLTDAGPARTTDYDWQVRYTARQSQADGFMFASDQDSVAHELMYGGAKFGGKTVYACHFALSETLRLIEQCGLLPQSHPPVVGFMGRKVAKDFSETTLQTWFAMIPPALYKARGKPVQFIIAARAIIQTGGLDRTEDIQKFNSAELAFAVIDQAEETTRSDIMTLRAATEWRKTLNGVKIPGKMLFTANPAKGWLKEDFITGEETGRVHRDSDVAVDRLFVQALPTDNPHLSPQYLTVLEKAYSHRPDLLAAYLYGDWAAVDDPKQIILDGWIQSAIDRQGDPASIRRVIACDTARFGDDLTVMLDMSNAEINERRSLPRCPITQIATELAQMSRKAGGASIAVESTGADLGAGVVDILMGMGLPVIVFTPQGKAIQDEVFYNLRAEAWDNAAKMFQSGLTDRRTSTIMTCHTMYRELRDQLTWPRYNHRGQRTLVEDKESIKERCGRSPDDADAYIIGLWALAFVPPISYSDYDVRHRNRPRSAMSM